MKNLIIKPKYIFGKNVFMRNANKLDAEFILKIRKNHLKGKFLSRISNDLNEQIKWLENYESDNSQVYFIIENKNSERFGTIRLYDEVGDSFCWGSWLLNENSPSVFAIESVLMIYLYAFEMGFKKSHFDVRKENASVWAFHERFGAVRVNEDHLNYYYVIMESQIKLSLNKYRKYLPEGVDIMW
jgi:RimJ/RimL family protein N-acetyltransferase